MRLEGQKTHYIGDITYKTEDDTLKHIENCARLCYRSNSSKNVASRNNFLHGLNEVGHGSLFEHSQFVIDTKSIYTANFLEYIFDSGQYRFFDLDHFFSDGIIGGNLRCWFAAYKAGIIKGEILGCIKAALPVFLKDWDLEPTYNALLTSKDIPHALRRFAAYAEVDRGVLGEFTRHDFGFSVESSRYCNYSKEKYATEVNMADQEAVGFFCKDPKDNERARQIWADSCCASEKAYMDLVEITKPEIARQVLNMSLLTRMYISGIPLYWNNFFAMRRPVTAHPNIRAIAEPLYAAMATDIEL